MIKEIVRDLKVSQEGAAVGDQSCTPIDNNWQLGVLCSPSLASCYLILRCRKPRAAAFRSWRGARKDDSLLQQKEP
jgi:hypothetical protein